MFTVSIKGTTNTDDDINMCKGIKHTNKSHMVQFIQSYNTAKYEKCMFLITDSDCVFVVI